MTYLESLWNEKKKQLIERFEFTNRMTKFYGDMFGKLDCYMRDKNSPEISLLHSKTIWLIYRFLNEESKRVMVEFKSN